MPRRHLPWLLAMALLLVLPAASPAAPWIGVKGNQLVDENGETVRLLGVNRSGAEYACVEEGGIFEGPTDAASIEAMKSWHINVVRVPLNESCWLGHSWIEQRLSGSAYRAAVREYVTALEDAGLYVILDLHWAAPRHEIATGLLPLPDAEHAPEFWRSVATEYRDDRAVIFDLYNEPHDVSWECWEAACQTYDKWFGWYQSVGLPELLKVVRATGARQPVMLGGLDWSRDLRGWLGHKPKDRAVVAANHTYDFSLCDSVCRQTLARIARHVPVVTGELGQGDCSHWYIDPYMKWADRHGISYLGWNWGTGGRWTCTGGPSLISDWAGSPTAFGKGFREHLRRLHRKAEAEARKAAEAAPTT
ncbi:MAG TPA: glycoside hydrolase family 5 protein [Solirubrobacterales bacterium]|nr:glycoside hydrolase family 5 protein [Solirubrobacterales bacterium]